MSQLSLEYVTVCDDPTDNVRAEFGILESDILVKNANLIILALKSWKSLRNLNVTRL